MAGRASNGVASARRPAVYDWETEFKEDPRRRAVEQALDRILLTSFPAVAARLHKAEPPRERQQSAVAPDPAKKTTNAPPVTKPEPLQAKPPRVQRLEHEEIDASVYASDAEVPDEIDPREALREMEARVAQGLPPIPEKHGGPLRRAGDGGDVDVVMEENGGGPNDVEEEGEDEEDVEQTACVVCQKSDNETQILICDGCENEYHLYCLRPPLAAVPPGDWFCVACKASRPSLEPTEPTEAMDVDDDEPLSAQLVRIKQEKARAMGVTPTNGVPESSPVDAAASVNIAQTFENDAQKSNELLVHACHCDAFRCVDPMFRDFCPHMKRFLRSACWASHNDKWMTYRIAQATAELFAYHSLHCDAASCFVPMCEELRAEEYV